jgi:hypothetical protein
LAKYGSGSGRANVTGPTMLGREPFSRTVQQQAEMLGLFGKKWFRSFYG